MDIFDISGRVALVTGASSGLGAEFARALAAAGAKVVAGARRANRLEEVVAAIKADGGDAVAVALDVTDSASIAGAFDAAERAFGTVTILVNNAGISRAGTMLGGSVEDWDAVLDTNLKAVWQVGREAAERMVAADCSGSIINISSLLAFGAAKGLGSYMAAKGGVVQLTKAMALEWADKKIRANAIAPGFVPTEINDGFFESRSGQAMVQRIPQRRVGTPAELIGPLMLLASDASSYMTGSVVTVDGGHLCSQL